MFIKGEATHCVLRLFCFYTLFPAMIASVSLFHPAGAAIVWHVPGPGTMCTIL
jgi:hypothetical protein